MAGVHCSLPKPVSYPEVEDWERKESTKARSVQRALTARLTRPKFVPSESFLSAAVGPAEKPLTPSATKRLVERLSKKKKDEPCSVEASPLAKGEDEDSDAAEEAAAAEEEEAAAAEEAARDRARERAERIKASVGRLASVPTSRRSQSQSVEEAALGPLGLRADGGELVSARLETRRISRARIAQLAAPRAPPMDPDEYYAPTVTRTSPAPKLDLGRLGALAKPKKREELAPEEAAKPARSCAYAENLEHLVDPSVAKSVDVQIPTRSAAAQAAAARRLSKKAQTLREEREEQAEAMEEAAARPPIAPEAQELVACFEEVLWTALTCVRQHGESPELLATVVLLRPDRGGSLPLIPSPCIVERLRQEFPALLARIKGWKIPANLEEGVTRLRAARDALLRWSLRPKDVKRLPRVDEEPAPVSRWTDDLREVSTPRYDCQGLVGWHLSKGHAAR